METSKNETRHFSSVPCLIPLQQYSCHQRYSAQNKKIGEIQMELSDTILLYDGFQKSRQMGVDLALVGPGVSLLTDTPAFRFHGTKVCGLFLLLEIEKT